MDVSYIGNLLWPQIEDPESHEEIKNRLNALENLYKRHREQKAEEVEKRKQEEEKRREEELRSKKRRASNQPRTVSPPKKIFNVVREQSSAKRRRDLVEEEEKDVTRQGTPRSDVEKKRNSQDAVPPAESKDNLHAYSGSIPLTQEIAQERKRTPRSSVEKIMKSNSAAPPTKSGGNFRANSGSIPLTQEIVQENTPNSRRKSLDQSLRDIDKYKQTENMKTPPTAPLPVRPSDHSNGAQRAKTQSPAPSSGLTKLLMRPIYLLKRTLGSFGTPTNKSRSSSDPNADNLVQEDANSQHRFRESISPKQISKRMKLHPLKNVNEVLVPATQDLGCMEEEILGSKNLTIPFENAANEAKVMRNDEDRDRHIETEKRVNDFNGDDLQQVSIGHSVHHLHESYKEDLVLKPESSSVAHLNIDLKEVVHIHQEGNVRNSKGIEQAFHMFETQEPEMVQTQDHTISLVPYIWSTNRTEIDQRSLPNMRGNAVVQKCWDDIKKQPKIQNETSSRQLICQDPSRSVRNREVQNFAVHIGRNETSGMEDQNKASTISSVVSYLPESTNAAQNTLSRMQLKLKRYLSKRQVHTQHSIQIEDDKNSSFETPHMSHGTEKTPSAALVQTGAPPPIRPPVSKTAYVLPKPPL